MLWPVGRELATPKKGAASGQCRVNSLRADWLRRFATLLDNAYESALNLASYDRAMDKNRFGLFWLLWDEYRHEVSNPTVRLRGLHVFDDESFYWWKDSSIDRLLIHCAVVGIWCRYDLGYYFKSRPLLGCKADYK
jgi:hypothetical protein